MHISVIRSYLFSNHDIYPLVMASPDMISMMGLNSDAQSFCFMINCHYLAHSHIQSWIYIFGGNMNTRTLQDTKRADYKHLQSQKADTTNICSLKKRTLQNICSLKKRTLQNICSLKKRTLQIVVINKGDTTNFFSLKKRTLQNLLMEV